MRRQLHGHRPTVGIAVVLTVAAPGGPALETSFEGFAPGPLTELCDACGTWAAAEGHAEVKGRYSRSGKQCLRAEGEQRPYRVTRLRFDMRYNLEPSRAVAVTRDLGQTWAEHPTSVSALPEPGACMAGFGSFPGAVAAVPHSPLLFSNPAVPDRPRRQMTIKVSLDQGKTWPNRLHTLLDAGASAGYSCLTAIDAETVGILYEGSRASLTFQRLRIRELLWPVNTVPVPAPRP